MNMEDYDNGQVHDIHGECSGFYPTLFINDANLLEELFVTKNKYFDKDPLFKDLLSPLVGDSLLFAESDLLWKQKRTELADSFKKDKLMKYLDIIRDDCQNAMKEMKWYADKG